MMKEGRWGQAGRQAGRKKDIYYSFNNNTFGSHLSKILEKIENSRNLLFLSLAAWIISFELYT